MGGLGNQMFQYATARAIAHRINTKVKLDLTLLRKPKREGNETHRDYELSPFKIDASIASMQEANRFNLLSSDIVNRVGRRIRNIFYQPAVYIQSGVDYHENILGVQDNTCIIGSFQSEKYFSVIEPIIRKEFSFQDDSFLGTNEYIDEIRNSHAVAVHVRRGDYVEHEKYSQTLGAKGLGYYDKAFKIIGQKVSNPVLFVFSDDVAWCKSNLDAPFPVRYVSGANAGKDAWKDLLLLSSCKHFIIPNSTFGWWGAWLGNSEEKIVLAPELWSANGALHSNDRIPERWTKI